MRLSTADLDNPVDVDRLYHFLVQCQVLIHSEVNRVNVHATAVLDSRLCSERPWFVDKYGKRRKRVVKDIFRKATTEQRWWHLPRDTDEAVRRIRIVDARDPTKCTGTREDKVALVQQELARRKAAAQLNN